jgi:hypothetical protein
MDECLALSVAKRQKGRHLKGKDQLESRDSANGRNGSKAAIRLMSAMGGKLTLTVAIPHGADRAADFLAGKSSGFPVATGQHDRMAKHDAEGDGRPHAEVNRKERDEAGGNPKIEGVSAEPFPSGFRRFHPKPQHSFVANCSLVRPAQVHQEAKEKIGSKESGPHATYSNRSVTERLNVSCSQ